MYSLLVLLLLAILLLVSLDMVSGGCSSPVGVELQCSAIGLTEFPTISSEDASLVEILDLSHNEITTIRASDLQNFTRLRELELQYNDITYIEEGSFSTNSTLSTVLLSNNPLHCDCGLGWLLEYLSTLAEDSGAVCGSPSPLAGSLLSNLTLSQLSCECNPECSGNSTCNNMLGQCECSPGYRGDDCSLLCSEGLFGLNCNESCSCGDSSCHHITGECICPAGYVGTNCSQNCTRDCSLQSVKSSLKPPENSGGHHKYTSANIHLTLIQPLTLTSVLSVSSSSFSSFYGSMMATPPPSSSSSPSDDSTITQLEMIVLSLGLVLLIIIILALSAITLLMMYRGSMRRKRKISPKSEKPETIPLECNNDTLQSN